MSIFLSERYIKEGIGFEEIDSLKNEHFLENTSRHSLYQKKINSEIECRLNAES